MTSSGFPIEFGVWFPIEFERSRRQCGVEGRDAGTTGAAGASAPVTFCIFNFAGAVRVQCGCRLGVQPVHKTFTTDRIKSQSGNIRSTVGQYWLIIKKMGQILSILWEIS